MATLHMRLRPHTCTHVIPEKHLKEGTGFLFLDPPAVELTSCSWVEPRVMHLIMNLLLHHEPWDQLHILIRIHSFIYTYEQFSWKPKNCTTNLVPPTKINLHFFSTYFSTLCVCNFTLIGHSVQFSSFAQTCPILWDPTDCSTPGFPVHHQLPEFTQIHVHWASDAIQPSQPPAFNLSQHQGLLKWVSSSHQVAKVMEFQLQHQSFQWIIGHNQYNFRG